MMDRRKAWIAWTNTDLTEGRGYPVPLCVCVSRFTAERLGAGKSVQGSDCRVEECKVFKDNDVWYGPIRLIYPSTEDQQKEKEYQSFCKRMERHQRRDELIKKLRSMGITDDEIGLLL